MYLHDLPEAHPDRNRPVKGLYHRFHSWRGEDITIPAAERDTYMNKNGNPWKWWGATGWKMVPLDAKNPWPIAEMTYNELAKNGFWTRDSDWATTEQPPRKRGELKPKQ